MKRAEGAYHPTVSLSSSLNYTDQEADDFQRSGSVSLSAEGPIYTGGRLPALLRQATARRDAQRSVLHLTRLRLEQEAGSALPFAMAIGTRSKRGTKEHHVAFEGVAKKPKLVHEQPRRLKRRTRIVGCRRASFLQRQMSKSRL